MTFTSIFSKRTAFVNLLLNIIKKTVTGPFSFLNSHLAFISMKKEHAADIRKAGREICS